MKDETFPRSQPVKVETTPRRQPFFEDSPLICVVTQEVDGQPFISDCNDRFTAELGYSHAEVLGTNLALYYTQSSRQALLEGGGYQKALRGEISTEERQLVTRDGRILETLLKAVPYVDPVTRSRGTCAMYVDVTDSKRASRARAKRTAQLELVSQVTRAYLETSDWPRTCGRLLAAAVEQTQSRCGWILILRGPRLSLRGGEHPIEPTPAERLIDLRDEQHDEILEAFDLGATHPIWRTLGILDESSNSHLCSLPQGTTGALVVSGAPSYGEDDSWYLGFLAQTIGLVIFNQEQREREATLRTQLLQSQKLEALGRLAGGIAHDFNNVLMAIGAHCSLLIDDLGQNPGARSDACQIAKQVERAAALTRQLLAFGRPPVGSTEVLDLGEVIQSLEPMLRRLLSPTVTLDIHLAPEPSFVHGPRSQMEQVLLNLLVNGADSMPDGGQLSIRTSLREAEAGKREVLVEVQDTGEGIPADLQNRIFEPFFTTKTPGKGTGLGLSIVHGIVTNLGGTIGIDSARGRGTTFFLSLPESEARPADSTSPAKLSPVPGAERLLLVEDESSVRTALARNLRRLGYRVVEAEDALVALQTLRDGSTEIDILLSDIALPNMSGQQLARVARAERPNLPIVLMSGRIPDEEASIERGTAEPEIPVLAKPMEMNTLVRALHTASRSRGQTRS